MSEEAAHALIKCQHRLLGLPAILDCRHSAQAAVDECPRLHVAASDAASRSARRAARTSVPAARTGPRGSGRMAAAPTEQMAGLAVANGAPVPGSKPKKEKKPKAEQADKPKQQV